MKRLLLLIFSWIVLEGLSAQELTVKSMTVSPMDLSASKYERKDLTGKACGLVKVQLPTTGTQFEGNVIGNPEYKAGEYWVYMTEGSYMLSVKHPGFIPLDVSFRDYGILGIDSKTTYKLLLLTLQTQKLVINYMPTDAVVVVDGKTYQGNGHLDLMLPIGTHDYQIVAMGYDAVEGSVKLNASSSRTIIEKLVLSQQQIITQTERPIKAQVSVEQKTGTNPFEDPEIVGMTAQQIRDLGHDYFEGTGGKKKNYTKAMKYTRISAEQGNTDAMNDIGVRFYKGKSVKKDKAEAARWFRKAAEQGDIQAQMNLGLCYWDGEGVEVNYAESIKWYRKAAEQGNAECQLFLARQYSYGIHIDKDEAEAIKWYRKAADQGNAQAQLGLGACYQYGRGVSIDLSQAKFWYEKAAAQGNKFAKRRSDDLAK